MSNIKYDFEYLDTEVSAKILRKFIENRMEDVETPKKVRDYLLEHEGKPITKRHSAAISALIGHTVTIRKQFGMTHLDWMQPAADGSNDHFSMIIAYAERNVVIPGREWFDQYCAREISAAENRNEQRRNILNDPRRLLRLARDIRRFREACKALKLSLDASCNDIHEMPDNPDDCAIKRMFVIP